MFIYYTVQNQDFKFHSKELQFKNIQLLRIQTFSWLNYGPIFVTVLPKIKLC